MLLLHINSTKAYLNDKEIKLDETNPTIVPIIRNGKTMIPLRFFSETMGAQVIWNSVNKSISIKNGSKTIQISTGKKEYCINTISGNFTVPPQTINGRTYVELRGIVENLFGKKIFYNSNLIAIANTQEELLPLNNYDTFIEKKKLFYSKNLSLNRVEEYDKDGNKVVGFINEWGKFIISPIYKYVGDFEDGMCYVKDPETQQVIFLNEKNEKLTPKYSYDYPWFSDGLLVVKVNGLYGYMDKKGELIIEPQFNTVGSFQDGMSFVRKNGKFFIMNKKCELLLDLSQDKFKDINRFMYCGNNIYLIDSIKTHKYGYMKADGDIIIPPQFDGADDDFREGVAFVSKELGADDIHALIDLKGNFITDYIYTSVQPFSEGLASVYDKTDKKYKFIDKTGKTILFGDFTTIGGEDIGVFSEGLAAVGFPSDSRIAGLYGGGQFYGYINKLGETVIQPQYIRAGSFKGGLAEVWTLDTVGYINTSGKYVWKRNLTSMERKQLSPLYEP